ncbi:hypothetical protein [Kocuria rosea]|uniref:hypothetical protein n=1 Tax=Kocuria rosea TaxID=1275 RepID=UPI0020423AEB|nr:hypothetical protein [Kocuria rosea]MCM3687888.1 hypothetical protein [Kocuria rosea]
MPARIPLQAGERVLVSTRAHGLRLLRPFLVLLLTVFALSLVQRALALRWNPVVEPWATVRSVLDYALLAAAAWVLLRRVLLPVVRWWRTRYVLTTRHLVLVRGRRAPVALPLRQLRRAGVEPGRGPALGRRDGRVVADFGPYGGLRLEHAPEARRLAELVLLAAGEERGRGPGGHGPFGGAGEPGATGAH